MQTKITKWAFVVLLVALLISIATCRYHSKQTDKVQSVLDTTIAAFKTFKSKEGKQVAEQAPAEFSSAKPLKEASAKAFNLSKKEERKIKDVESFVQVAQVAKIKNDSTEAVAVSDSVYRFDLNRPHYAISGRIKKDWLYIDSLAIYNTISIRVAEKREGLLGLKSSLVIQAVNSNPYVTTQAMRSMEVAHRQNAWNKWIKPALFAGIGFAAGRGLK